MFPKPISWPGMENQNLTQQKHTFTNQKKCTTQNKHKKQKPGLVASYDIRPGNREEPILTYLDTYLLTYSPDPHGAHLFMNKIHTYNSPQPIYARNCHSLTKLLTKDDRCIVKSTGLWTLRYHWFITNLCSKRWSWVPRHEWMIGRRRWCQVVSYKAAAWYKRYVIISEASLTQKRPQLLHNFFVAILRPINRVHLVDSN